uniref:Major capsid protein L1 n=2 Tax=Human papillomavirus TaxID=10566 RepID=A0A385PLN0_9PAPI|nr:MAG: L1 protein [Human papillomavirus]
MALWLQNQGKLYLPPAKPVARVLGTDEYIIETDLFFHANTERLLTVGHPYFNVPDAQDESKIAVPKCSGNQYRCLRLNLPDPNKFALIDDTIFNPERERLVWRVKGLEVSRGGPLGVGTVGHPLFNKFGDTENSIVYPPKQTKDDRQQFSQDPKQVQLLIVGCTPAVGEHWDVAKFCADHVPQKGECPPIQLVTTFLQDGDMCDIGYGNANFKAFQENRSDVPLDIVDATCKWPDFVKMTKEAYGDSLFFFTRKEQLYARHYYARGGAVGDSIPGKSTGLFINPENSAAQHDLASSIYFPVVSGSLISSEGQIFNKPYWLQRAQGPNNGICWDNQLFITYVDNTRNYNFTLSVFSDTGKTLDENYVYDANDFREYLRHIEEVELELIFQLCKVPLNADVLAHLNVMNPNILENWQLSFVPPPPQGIEDAYRYITSNATKCPTDLPPDEKPDPYKDYKFWNIDLRERFSSELTQFPLGRKFLFQAGLLGNKRLRTSTSTVSSGTKRVKRKRTK